MKARGTSEGNSCPFSRIEGVCQTFLSVGRSSMTAQTIQETLRGVRFFDGIPEREQQRIASLGRLEEYEPEEIIFREGQRRGSVFVVADGSVALDIRVPEHGGRWFQTVNAGGLVGWSPI